jgi:hypothetical protein
MYDEPTIMIVEPTKMIVEPTNMIVEPTKMIVEPTNMIVEPTKMIVEPTNMIVELTNMIVEPTIGRSKLAEASLQLPKALKKRQENKANAFAGGAPKKTGTGKREIPLFPYPKLKFLVCK